jgi:hypothetical protein
VSPNGQQIEHIQSLGVALARAKKDALRLWRPLHDQHRSLNPGERTQLDFLLSTAMWRLLRGGNQSGKSVTAAAEFASAARGIPLRDHLGNPIPMKFPTDRPLILWVVGYDEDHIGRKIHTLLFKAGAFDIIKDRETGEWRAWRPWEPDDAARKEECKPAPPLIPPSQVQSWAWENKSQKVFRICTLNPRAEWNGAFPEGTEIRGMSSKAEAKQGDQVDGIWIDEDVWDAKHIDEYRPRLAKRGGRFWWSAFPHSTNEALVTMTEQAELDVANPEPETTETVLRFRDNPFIGQKEKNAIIAGWGEIEAISRDEGHFQTENTLVYPGFNKNLHGLPVPASVVVHAQRQKIADVLEARGWEPPTDWARYLVVDPGHSQAAVLFAAVPPPSEYGDYVVVYDELYPWQKNAEDLAKLVAPKMAGPQFQSFIIDFRASRMTLIGVGRTIGDQYVDAFKRLGIRSAATGSQFVMGSDDVQGRIGDVRNWLSHRDGLPPRLLIVLPKTPHMQWEFGRYKKRLKDDIAQDVPVEKHNHLMNCLEYLAAYNPKYVPPQREQAAPSSAYLAFKEWLKESPAKKDDSIYLGAGAPV